MSKAKPEDKIKALRKEAGMLRASLKQCAMDRDEAQADRAHVRERADKLATENARLRESNTVLQRASINTTEAMKRLRDVVSAYEAEEQRIIEIRHKHPLMSDKVTTHDGPPLYTHETAMAEYRKYTGKLAKGALAEGDVFYGDAKKT